MIVSTKIDYYTGSFKYIYRSPPNGLALIEFNYISLDKKVGLLTGFNIDYCSQKKRPYTTIQEFILSYLCLANYLLFIFNIFSVVFCALLIIKFQIINVIQGLLGVVLIHLFTRYVQKKEESLLLFDVPYRNGWIDVVDIDRITLEEANKINSYLKAEKRKKELNDPNPNDSKN